MGASLRACRPGEEVSVLRGMVESGALDFDTVLLVGERAALVPGLLSEVARLSEEIGLRFAWVPRRAGELGAVRAGCLPGLLPAGRAADDIKARIELAAMWHMPIPDSKGMDASAMLTAAAEGELVALVVGGVEVADLPDPDLADRALERAFTVSLEQRVSAVTRHADVVLPVALLEQQEGTFIDWVGQLRHVGLVDAHAVSPMPDVRVLDALAAAMGKDIAMRNPAQVRQAYAELDDWRGVSAPRPRVSAQSADHPRLVLDKDAIEVTLAGWRTLLDDSRCLDGAEPLRRIAPRVAMRMSPVTAAKVGLFGGADATLTHGEHTWTGPVEVVTMVDDGVWVPLRADPRTYGWLAAQPGDRVRLSLGGVA
jgi:NADH-quinone oxidoreductase subunit G